MALDILDVRRPKRATRADAADLADLIVIAGEGLPLVIWEGMREPGETAMDVGRRRAEREEGGFSFRNALVIRDRGRAVSALVSYPLTAPTTDSDLQAAPAVFRPLLVLENALTPSWYVNVLATRESARRQGCALRLLDEAETLARRAGHDRLTLITADINPARGLYERFGFRERTSAPIVTDTWRHEGEVWIAYEKPLDP
jgi:ribosomal protein S18 acetylase RimI-like enzyme